MGTAKHTVILLALALLTTAPAQSMDKPAEDLSETRIASCLVKITADPAVLPLNFETLDYLLHSSGVGVKAARQILDVSPDQVRDFFIIEYVHELISDAKSKSPKGGSPGMEGGMDEYEYAMMMEAEMMEGYGMGMMNPTGSMPSTRSSRGRRRTPRIPSTGRTITTSDLSADEQTFLFSLSVHLPEDIKPLAKEYMSALVDNLRQVLTDAYNAYGKEIQNLIEFAESQRDQAQSQLAKSMEQIKATGSALPIKQNPADEAVYHQLEQVVDLSMLSVEMSFAEVIGELENSVEPPLQIQPNWKDLLENAEVEQTTAAGMDPLTSIKLRKALEILLAGVSGDFAELKYVVDEGVILIATEDALPSKMVPRVYEIPSLTYSSGGARDLVSAIQNTIDPESWFETSDMGEGSISIYLGNKLAILQTPDIHRKIQEFLQSITIDIPASIPSDVPAEIHLTEKRSLLREKQNLEMETASLQARQLAIGQQVALIRDQMADKMGSDPVTAELQAIVDMRTKQLHGIKMQAEAGNVLFAGVEEITEKLARAKIELAQRREQLRKSAGGDQLVKFNNDLAEITIELADKKAGLQVLSNQLDQTEQQLRAATMLDPQASQIRLATQAFEIADRRVKELNALALSVQPPTVSVLGAE